MKRTHCPVTGAPYPSTRWIIPTTFAIWIVPYFASAFLLPGWLWLLVRMIAFTALVAGTIVVFNRLMWRRWKRKHPVTPEAVFKHFVRTMRARYENAWLN